LLGGTVKKRKFYFITVSAFTVVKATASLTRGERLSDKAAIRRLVVESLPLLLVLLGVALIAFSMGPYGTWDTQLEFEAASNVVKMGIPYVSGFGTVIDQPPLGFYIEGLAFATFGLSINTGITLVTLFGLGSVVVMYLIGKEFYGKFAGLFAAALFGLNPWHLALSRSFLIDAQCLFFSLLCLYAGVLAIRKGSVKIALVAGLAFAAALLTKSYAAFILIPLLLLFLCSRPKNLKRIVGQLSAFSIPVFVFSYLWYQVFLGRPMLMIFQHNDLNDVVPASTGVVTSPFFVTNFLANYGLGWFLIAAIAFSVVIGFSFRKHFSKYTVIEVVSLVTIAVVLGVNLYLGAVLNLNVPYFSAIKYDYQALPFFILLAAALIPKSLSLFYSAKSAVNQKRLLLYALAAAAVVLAIASLVSTTYYTNAISTRSYLQYRVEPQVDYGYALSNPTPLIANSPLMAVQFIGFAVVAFALLWTSIKLKSAGGC
jgi:4-amino-4-deoxy-L-arabinose transferase-like glycosyltransferase